MSNTSHITLPPPNFTETPPKQTDTTQKIVDRFVARLGTYFSERQNLDINIIDNDFLKSKAIIAEELLMSARRSVLFMDYMPSSTLEPGEKENPMLSTPVLGALQKASKDGLFVSVCSGITEHTYSEKCTTFFKPLVPLPVGLQFIVVDESLWYYASKNVSAYCANNTFIGDRLSELFNSFVVSSKH